MEKKVTTEITVIREVFTWEIVNYSFNSKPTGNPLRSPSFFIGPNNDFTWYLLLFPEGVCENDRHKVLILVVLEKSARCPVTAEIAFFTLDLEKKKVPRDVKRMHKFNGTNEHVEYEFSTKENLQDYLVDDKLRILCEISVGLDMLQSTAVIEKPIMIVTSNRLSQDFASLFENGTMSDVRLVVEEQKFHVHKAILSARSPVFKALFENDMEEKNKNSIELKEDNCEAFEGMLKFVYSGKVENLEKSAYELLSLSDKYQMDDLKSICEEALCRGITTTNAIDFLILADLHQAAKLKNYTIDLITTQIKCFVDDTKFKSLENCPSYISLYREIFHTIASKQSK